MSKIVTAAGALALVAVLAAAAPKAAPAGGVFAPLKEGQKVGLKEVAGGYQITVMPGVELASKVIEVGAEYVVLEDPAGVTQTRIPVYAVRAVVVTRLPGK
jgi:hypothetical protein